MKSRSLTAFPLSFKAARKAVLMSYEEAVEDGVRFSKDKRGGSWYFPLCVECDAEVPNWGYKRGTQYRCKKCRAEKALSDKETKADEGLEIKEHKFKNAVERISKVIKPKDKDKYDRATDIVHKSLRKPGWFDSTVRRHA